MELETKEFQRIEKLRWEYEKLNEEQLREKLEEVTEEQRKHGKEYFPSLRTKIASEIGLMSSLLTEKERTKPLRELSIERLLNLRNNIWKIRKDADALALNIIQEMHRRQVVSETYGKPDPLKPQPTLSIEK